MAFAVVGGDGEFRGMTTFYDFASSVPRVEIGHTHYGRRFWGGVTNPACKLLLLSHAFDVWGCVRVALRCDATTARSARPPTSRSSTRSGLPCAPRCVRE